MSASLKEYGEVPVTVPLEFMEDSMMWVTSKVSRSIGVLQAEAIELRNWILCFRCPLKDLRVVVAILEDCIATHPHPPGTPITHEWHVT